MNNIRLTENKGFQWFNNDTVFVKGYFFDAQNNFYQNETLVNHFKGVETNTEFINKITSANGVFTVLIKQSTKIFVASDTSRMFPLFYTFQDNKLFIYDNINFLKEELNDEEIDEQSVKEFNAAAYTTGNKTLIKNVYQLQSNEYIIFKDAQTEKQAFFFSYSTNNEDNNLYPKLKQQAIVAFESAFKRLIVSLDNRPVILPLSGGYDSRLIAVILKKFNYKNVICFTFGRKENVEIENSRKTANALGFKWLFIEYTNDLISGFLNNDLFKEYADFAGKHSSMPFLQEYFAVKYMKKNKLIADNSIFIPGHSGDFLGGSQLYKVVNENLKTSDIPALIIKSKYFHNKLASSRKTKIKENIRKALSSFNKNLEENYAYSVFEDYDIKEKLAKYIFNSTSVFNYFGFEHRLPFWDKELLTFFKNVPFKYKKMKLLYDDILTNQYFKPFNVNFETEIQPSFSDVFIQKIKNKVKPLLPHFIRKHYLKKNDWQNYEYITNEMILSMKKNNLLYNSRVKNYNEIIVQWYLFFVKGLIK